MKMRSTTLILWAAVTTLATASPVRAASPHAKNRLLIGPRLGFGLQANFRPAGGAGAANPGPPTGGAVNRTYENGFVGVDGSGNAGDQTWNWGYQDASQVDLAADTLAMNASSGDRPLFQDVSDDPQVGAEALYQRLLGVFGGAEWGAEVGVSWLPLDIRNDQGFNATWTSVTDVYSLGGITPPAPPYHGSGAGPGPAIGSVPSRTSTPQNVVVNGNQRIQSQVFGLRLGPVLDVPMGDPLSLQLSGGLLVTYANSEFSYREKVHYPDGSVGETSSSRTANDWLVGGYLRGQIIVHLSQRLGLYAAAEYQTLPDVDLQAGPWQATLRMGGALYGSGGVVFQF